MHLYYHHLVISIDNLISDSINSFITNVIYWTKITIQVLFKEHGHIITMTSARWAVELERIIRTRIKRTSRWLNYFYYLIPLNMWLQNRQMYKWKWLWTLKMLSHLLTSESSTEERTILFLHIRHNLINWVGNCLDRGHCCRVNLEYILN